MRYWIFAFLAVFSLAGCTGVLPQGRTDCGADSGCLMQAFRNGCHDAVMENIRDKAGYTLGTADLRVSVANTGGSCKVEAVWSDASNRTISSVEEEFRLPLESCGSSGSYVAADGGCKRFDIG